MWVYFIIIFVALYCTNSQDIARSKVYLTFFLLGLALLAGFGDMLGGYDRYAYCDLFDRLFDDRINGVDITKSPIWGYQKEFGYVWVNYAITFITGNRYIFILIYTLFIYILFFFSLKEYMENYPVAIVLFLAMMYFFTFTYLREVLGVTMAWLGVRYVYKRNLPMFLLFAFLAFSCHNSGIIFLPLFFIPIRKFNKIIVITVMIILLVIGLSNVPGAMYSAFGDYMGDSNRVQQYVADYDRGFLKLDYLIEATFFLYVIFKNYDNIPNTKKDIVLLNTAILFCGILLLFIRSSSGGRLGWYYMVGIIATMTRIITLPNAQDTLKRNILFVCFILFARIVFLWGILLSPYKTFLSNGHRDGDIIFEWYEYDNRYDEDKLYRPVYVLGKSEEEIVAEGW